jgi:hypothetical protein
MAKAIDRLLGFTAVFFTTSRISYRPLAHDVIAPVTMHLEDKLAIYT